MSARARVVLNSSATNSVGESRRFAHPNAHFASHAVMLTTSLTVRNLRESQCYVYIMFTQDPNPTSATTRNRGQGETCRFDHLICEVAIGITKQAQAGAGNKTYTWHHLHTFLPKK